MPLRSSAEISKLCDDWCAASVTPAGGLGLFSNHTEKYRLLRNGIDFSELSFEALCAALVGLTKVLLRPGLHTIIDQDHAWMWSWCGELFLGQSALLFPSDQVEIELLYKTAVHAALANCRKKPTKEELQAQAQTIDLQPHHAKYLLQESHLVLAYLAFPLLESVLKRACSSFVSFDGKVLSSFLVTNKQGHSRRYHPNGKSNQCSSLRDLLLLHHSQVAVPEIKALLDQFRDHITLLDSAQDPFDLIYSWRNKSLHGSTNFQTIGGTIFNLSLLITLFEIQKDFEQRRAKSIANCQQAAQLPHKGSWSFYPPC